MGQVLRNGASVLTRGRFCRRHRGVRESAATAGSGSGLGSDDRALQAGDDLSGRRELGRHRGGSQKIAPRILIGARGILRALKDPIKTQSGLISTLRNFTMPLSFATPLASL